MAKSKIKKLSEDRIRLLKLKTQHERTVDLLENRITELNSEILDLESLKKEKKEIIDKIKDLKISQSEIETNLNENKSQKDKLTETIESLNTNKEDLDSYVSTNNPIRDELIVELSALNEEKKGVINTTNNLQKEIVQLEKNIKTQASEKKHLEDIIKSLREKYGLYSKDMKDIALDSKKQLLVYAITAIASFLGALTLMYTLLCVLTSKNTSFHMIEEIFTKNPNYQFYTLLIFRVTISAAFIFFFIVFINLTRGFIAQYIKTKNKMTAIRIADFLIGRIHTKGSETMPDDMKQTLEREKLKEQVELLNTHIPQIMDIGSSSFERISKTKDPTDTFKELLSLIKAKNLL